MRSGKEKIIVVLLLVTLIFSLFTIYIYSHEQRTLSARSAVLYEPTEKNFIYTKNPNERLAMASTTKILTALIALEKTEPDEIIEADKRACGIEGSSIYLSEGERLSAIDLIYALMLQSANDAALVLAYKIAGSIEGFAELMNEYAHSLGLENSNFTNPHGLDDKNHYTTAHDLAIITAKALENPAFREIASTYKKEIVSSKVTRILANHNKLLKSYKGCIGVKTGYTKKSGRSLVSAAERDGLTLISVTINAPDDWNDHRALFDFGFSLYEMRNLAARGDFSYDLPVIGGEKDSVHIENAESFSGVFKKTDGEIKANVSLPRYFSAPIKKGDILGEVVFLDSEGNEIKKLSLYAAEDIQKKKKLGLFN